MTIDYRALCAELLEALEIQLDELASTNRLCKRARAALAQPEPVGPTDEELLACHAKAFNAEMTASMNDYDIEEAGGLSRRIDRCSLAAARAVLARWGRPASTT